MIKTNDKNQQPNTQGSKVPNSGDLLTIANQLSTTNTGLAAMQKPLSELAGTVNSFSKIDPKKFKDGVSSFGDISKCFKSTTKVIIELVDSLKNISQEIPSNGSWENLINNLLGSGNQGKSAINTKPGANPTVPGSIGRHGLFDIIIGISNITTAMDNIVFINPIKFKIKFNNIINLIIWQLDKLGQIPNKIDKNVFSNVNSIINSLMSTMIPMVTVFNSLSDLLVRLWFHGFFIKRGTLILLGNKMDGKSGLLYDFQTVCKKLISLNKSLKGLDNTVKNINNFTKAIKGISTAFAITGISFLFIKIGMKVVKAMVKCFIEISTSLSENAEIFQKAQNPILMISLAIMGLSVSALLISVAGAMIMNHILETLAVVGFVVVLGIVFGLLGSKLFNHAIEAGSKSILKIGLALLILSVTAIMMAFCGQFIVANWASFLIFGAYLLLLVGAFMLLSFASKWIMSGAKYMLTISYTLAILVGITMIIGLVAQYVTQHFWDYCLFVLMVTILILPFMILAYVSKWIQKGVWTLMLLCIPILVMATIVSVLGVIVKSINMKQLSIAVGLMCGILILFAGAAVALGILNETTGGAVMLGVGLVIALCAPIVMFAYSLYKVAKAIELINKVMLEGGSVEDSIDLIFSTIKNIIKQTLDLPKAKLLIATGVMLKMRSLATSLGKMAKVICDIAAFHIPDGYDSKGKPTGYHNITSAEFITAAENVGFIVTFFTGIFSENGYTAPDGTNFKVDMEGLNSITRTTVRRMKRLNKIVTQISNMAKTLTDVAALKIPTEYGTDGKPTGYRFMTNTDFVNAAQNVGYIATFFTGIFNQDTGYTTPDGENFRIDLEGLNNISRTVVRRMKRLNIIVTQVSNMAKTVADVAALKIPIGYDKDGKPTGYDFMKDTDFTRAANNIAQIVSIFVTTLCSKTIIDLADNASRKATKNIARLMDTGAGMKGIVDVVAGLAEDKWKTFDANGKLINTVDLSKVDYDVVAAKLSNILKVYTGSVLDPEIVNAGRGNWFSKSNIDAAIKTLTGLKTAAGMITPLLDTLLKSIMPKLNQFKDKQGNISTQMATDLGDILSAIVKAVVSDDVVKKGKKSFLGLGSADIENATNTIKQLSKLSADIDKILTTIIQLNDDKITSITPKTIETRLTNLLLVPLNSVLPFTKKDQSLAPEKISSAANTISQISTLINNYSKVTKSILKLNSELPTDSGVYFTKVKGITVYKTRAVLFPMIDMCNFLINPKNISNNAFELISDKLKKLGLLSRGLNTIYQTSLYGDKLNPEIAAKNAETFKKNVDNTIRLISKIDSANEGKLKRTAEVLKHLAKLSENIRGNFDGLAEAINENLITAIEKLNETLEQVGDKGVESNKSLISNIIPAFNHKPTSDAKPVVKQQAPQIPENHKKSKYIIKEREGANGKEFVMTQV